MRGRLNLFQRMMLRWRDLQPYSAVHVVWVDAALDAAALGSAIRAQLAAWRLTGLTLDKRRRRFEYRGGPAAAEVTVPADRGNPERTLDAEIERQLNAPFSPGPDQAPFRFFAVPADGGFHFGLAYDHYVAGGDVIAGLLGAIVARHVGRPGKVDAPRLYPPTYRTLFAHRPMLLLRAVVQLPGLFITAKLALRPRYANADDTYNGYAHFRLSAAESAALRAMVSATGVTLNDWLLAVLFRAVAPLAPGLRVTGRRREIAIASIVNVRHEFGALAAGTFGQFLAALRVAFLPAKGAEPLPDVAREIHRVTAEIKRRRQYLRAVLALGIAALFWPFLTTHHRRRFFTKHNPSLGGVTILGVDGPWTAAGLAPPSGYLRGVSTGPVAPLVLAVSAGSQGLTVGITFRRGAHGPELIPAIEAELRSSLGTSQC